MGVREWLWKTRKAKTSYMMIDFFDFGDNYDTP